VFIGSDPDCQLYLDLASVSPVHARVWLDAGAATVSDTHSQGGVFVNDDQVSDQAALRDGDFLWLGAPGAEGSVLLQFRGPAPQADAATPSREAAGEPWAAASRTSTAAART
jgi:pSer/pThr/pTyr-binding forkhead associated (FHA) protein